MRTDSEVQKDLGELRRGCLYLLLSIVAMVVVIVFAKHHWKYSNNGSNVKILRTGAANWNAWRATNQFTLNFERSDLSGLDLSGANLENATFFRTYIGTDLSGTILRGANLIEASVAHSQLVQADLSNADLSRATFSFSDLRAANFSYANGQEAWFREANLSGADFRGADLTGASLLLADLTDAKLEGADFTAAYLVYADLREVEDWREIKSIVCANIFGVSAPSGFKEWALERGALVYDWNDQRGWRKACEKCMEENSVE